MFAAVSLMEHLYIPLGLTPSPSNPLALQAFGEMRCNKLGRFLNFAS